MILHYNYNIMNELFSNKALPLFLELESALNNQEKFSSLTDYDFFKMDFILDIIETFLTYPTLGSFAFNIKDLIQHATTWEGCPNLPIINCYNLLWDSPDNIMATQQYQDFVKQYPNEEDNFYVFCRNYFIGKDDDAIIPVNSSIRGFLYKGEHPIVHHKKLNNIFSSIDKKFVYLAEYEQPLNLLKELLATSSSNDIFFTQFEDEGTPNPLFLEELEQFLGKKILSTLHHEKLQQKLPSSSETNIKKNKI